MAGMIYGPGFTCMHVCLTRAQQVQPLPGGTHLCMTQYCHVPYRLQRCGKGGMRSKSPITIAAWTQAPEGCTPIELPFVRPEINEVERTPGGLLMLLRPVVEMDVRRVASVGRSTAGDGCTKPLAAGCDGSRAAAACWGSASGRCTVRTIAATVVESMADVDERFTPPRAAAVARVLCGAAGGLRAGPAARRSVVR